MSRLYRPRSFFSLLLSGFIFVALPLVIALVSSIQILDGLVQQGAVAVFRSVSRIDSSRKVAELLRAQERTARLFMVLGDAEQLKEVNTGYRELEELLAQFAALNTENDLAPLIEQLQVRERHLVTALNDAAGNPEIGKQGQEAALTGYGEIGSLASQLERLSNTLMIREVDLLKERVQSNKKALVWQVSGLIGFSVLLIVFFISLINKPVSQLDRGIERLGEGDFTTPIIVLGPRDLEVIGEKLDWLRKRLNTLDREKVKMLAHISHELKTPLSSIKEGAGLLKDGLVGPLSPNQAEVVAILDKNCNKLQKLIQNILDFNMAQAKEIPLDLQELRFDALIDEVAGDHRHALLARNIRLTTQLEPATVTGNRKQLKTVVDNLLANAIKFTPDNGDVGIYMKVKSNKVNVLIEDTGPGISEEDHSQIFQPFFQGSQENRSVVKGSGLGLAISKEYVQNCGGTLRLLPSSQGARFSVTLPRAKDGVE
ncbi:MAG: HAMP domain-containing histidine kinase [Desulfobulbaceae bacterium]|nr:HAMP domain-containing histidine kinase [Desulfobulbaceae bacterium]